MTETHALFRIYYIVTQRRHVFNCALHMTVLTECAGMLVISLSASLHVFELELFTVAPCHPSPVTVL
jgi:hypothetical protein